MNIKKIIKEEINDFDWVKDIQPETEWDKEKYYVLDIRSLSGVKLRETIDDIGDFAYSMDYDVEIGVQYDNVGYIYFEPNDEVPEGYALDWTPRKTTDPTFGGKYQMISLEEFYHMAYGDEPLNESNDFDWVKDIEELPIPGTAWIMEIDPKDSEEVQQKLFDVGFRWSSGSNEIDETSGVYTFVSYSNYDIKYKCFKMVKGDSYIPNNINNIINSTQPNDLFIYEYKDGTSKLKNTSLNESNDFDWTKDTGPILEWDKDTYYVVDLTPLSGLEFRETLDDIYYFGEIMGYNTELFVDINVGGYMYFEPEPDVDEGYILDWSDRRTKDPTFNGQYTMLSVENFYYLYNLTR